TSASSSERSTSFNPSRMFASLSFPFPRSDLRAEESPSCRDSNMAAELYEERLENGVKLVVYWNFPAKDNRRACRVEPSAGHGSPGPCQYNGPICWTPTTPIVFPLCPNRHLHR